MFKRNKTELGELRLAGKPMFAQKDTFNGYRFNETNSVSHKSERELFAQEDTMC